MTETKQSSAVRGVGSSDVLGRFEKTTWSRSMTEEVLAALWAIAAILCFGFGFNVAGGFFTIKAVIDTWASISFGIREARAEKRSNAALTGERTK